jgi:hypothetical protein
VQSGDVAQIEELELRHDLLGLGALVELDHERPRVGKDFVAEVDRAAGERAGVGLGVEDPQPVLEGVGDGTAGAQLDHEGRALAQGGHGVLQPGEVERGTSVAVADVDMHQTRPGTLAGLGGRDQLVERDREPRRVRLRGLRAGRRDRDQRPV